ncbi:MAG TPA: dTDP-4-dehydrorhamnose reductase [Vicinamibacterales bacterium]|nr:dTDP-4-dehydrorhamnose reductase [Vicinamibacterales bacterium]
MSASPRAIVFGAGGQLGAAIVKRLQDAASCQYSVTALTRADLDVTDTMAVARIVRDTSASLVVNCSAYNDVDRAERDAAAAFAVNAFAVGAMARACLQSESVFVHYSTDFVFDGEASEPYREQNRARPLGMYGASKLLGEWFAADAPRHYVLRVASLFGGSSARSAVDRIIAGLASGAPVPVFQDRTVSPSYVEDVVEATLRLLEVGAESGVYHCVSSGATSWLELGRRVAAELGADERLLTPVSVRDVTTPAKRPVYCALSNARLREAGVRMPEWPDAISRYVQRVQFAARAHPKVGA